MNLSLLLPRHTNTFVRALAWMNLCAQVLIVATGGLVRLTSSGLGCPTWPSCTPDSLVTTPEMGIHGVIEFGNRLMTFALVAIAIAAFLSVLRIPGRRDLRALAVAIGLGIPLQAGIGGLSVLTDLNPYVVGLHFVVSVALVSLATLFVRRSYNTLTTREKHDGAQRSPSKTGAWEKTLILAIGVFGTITILFGILTTGSGPHAGDADAPRNGLSSELLQHVHSWGAYALLAASILLYVVAFARSAPYRTWTIALLAVEGAQLASGIAQANWGLPPFLVGIHMVLACLFASVFTVVVDASITGRAADQTSLGSPGTMASSRPGETQTVVNNFAEKP